MEAKRYTDDELRIQLARTLSMAVGSERQVEEALLVSMLAERSDRAPPSGKALSEKPDR